MRRDRSLQPVNEDAMVLAMSTPSRAGKPTPPSPAFGSRLRGPFLLALAGLACGCGRSDLLLDDDPLDGGSPHGSLSTSSGAAPGSRAGSSGGPGDGRTAGGGSSSGETSSSGNTGPSAGASSGGNVFQGSDGTGDDGTSPRPDVTDSGIDGGPGCNAGTCAGCCSKGVCRPGHFQSECGIGGVACFGCDVEKNCAAAGDVCE